jgi:hypothetical protein
MLQAVQSTILSAFWFFRTLCIDFLRRLDPWIKAPLQIPRTRSDGGVQSDQQPCKQLNYHHKYVKNVALPTIELQMPFCLVGEPFHQMSVTLCAEQAPCNELNCDDTRTFTL